MSNRITLKDVAKHAGVSYQTVSKVLKGKGAVSPKTEQRIKAAVEALGYRPNIRARSLREQRSRLIGYSWQPTPPDIYNPILEKFLQSAIEAAEAEDYHLLTYPWVKATTGLNDYEDLIQTGRIDGLVLSSIDFDDWRVAKLIEMNFPFVAFGRANPDWDFAYVDVDGGDGLFQVTNHLIERGHRQLGVLGWPAHSRTGEDRLRGYHQALSTADIAFNPAWLARGEDRVSDGYQCSKQLLQLPKAQRPTTLICMSDTLAIGAMNAARDLGLRIGQDVAITGFDDYPMTQYLQPSLTTVRQPIWRVGQKIMALLIQLINGQRPENYQLLIKPELIIRQSTAGEQS